MGCIKQFFVSKAAESSLVLIRLKDPFPKRSLVQAYPDRGCHICSARRIIGAAV
jgi:hypothetical protein